MRGKTVKKVRAITVFAIAALCASGLAACSTSAENAGTDSAANPVVLKVAFNQPETHPQYIAMVNFGKKLKKETKGAYEIKMFPNELLGSQQDTIAGVQSGSIDMSIGNCWSTMPERAAMNADSDGRGCPAVTVAPGSTSTSAMPVNRLVQPSP